MASILTASAINSLGPTSVEDNITYATVLSISVGAIHMLLGAFRLGFVINFIPHAVLNGFTSAAALTIMSGQLKYILGVSAPNDRRTWYVLYSTFKNISEFKWQCLAVGIATIVVVLFFTYFWCTICKQTFTLRKVPAALVVVVLFTLFTFLLTTFTKFTVNEQQKVVQVHGIQIIAKIPAGLPSPFMYMVNDFDFQKFLDIVIAAVPIAFITFMESISIAKVFSRKEKYEISTNQELIALGAANIVGGLFKSYPATGSFSRSAVMFNAGAKTQLAGIISALIIMTILLLMTHWFYYLPYATLAGIIMVRIFL